MPLMINCMNCGEPIGYSRGDKIFCSPQCKAQYQRDAGAHRKRVHERLSRDLGCDCEQCGKRFRINNYADRRGARYPKFCSSACRQKAYRERKKQEAGKGT